MQEPIEPTSRGEGVGPLGHPPSNGEMTQAEGAVMTEVMMKAYMQAVKNAIARERRHQDERKKEERKAIEGG